MNLWSVEDFWNIETIPKRLTFLNGRDGLTIPFTEENNDMTMKTNRQGGFNMKVDSKFTGDYRIAAVKFTNTAQLYYFVLYDNNVEAGDYVAVDTKRGYTIGSVAAVYDGNANIESNINFGNIQKEVICKIDFTDYLTRKENREKKAALKAKLDKAIQENESLLLYKALAKENEGVAKLLAEYQQL